MYKLLALGVMLAVLAAGRADADPLTIRDYRTSMDLIKKYAAMDKTAQADYYGKHRSELVQAQQTLEDIQAIANGVAEANQSAMRHYGRPFLCNNDTAIPNLQKLIDGYQARMAAEHGLAADEVARRSAAAPLQSIIPDAMIREYRCPDWKHD